VTLYTHAGALPAHQYVWVEPDAIGRHDWLQGVWFGITSYPGRAFGCHVLFENGAVYRNVPLHQIASRKTDSKWTAADAQTWDAYGWQFSLIDYPYLSSMNARAKVRDEEHGGHYLFTLVPVGDAFSAAPTQSKEFYFLQLQNGRYTAQPTNRVLIEDRSFVDKLEWPTCFRRQDEWYSAEEVQS
jgi:hypothetical protein